jgi:hypothetical protein
MMKGDSRGQKGFGSQKGCLHEGSPGKVTSAFGGICEGFEDTGNTRKERTVKIQHAQEALQSFDIRGGREGKDGLDMGGKLEKGQQK